MGIEPTLPAWKAGTLPLSYTRLGPGSSGSGRGGSGSGEAAPRVSCRSPNRPSWGRTPGCRSSFAPAVPSPRGTMGGAGFEPAKVEPPDLQSGPFSHLGIHPNPFRSRQAFGRIPDPIPAALYANMWPRAGGESRTHNRRFTKPVLCRLSYASRHEAVKTPTISPALSNARPFSRTMRTGKDRVQERQVRGVPAAVSERDRVQDRRGFAVGARSCVGTIGEGIL
jgi:hypothetical protein